MGSSRSHSCLLVLAALVGLAHGAQAQPFGFLFGAPRPRAHRPRHATPAAIPLPVPRPHFPDDTPASIQAAPGVAATATHPAPAASAPAAPPVPQPGPPPASPQVAVPAGPPLPPPKPPDLAEAPPAAAPASPTPPPVVTAPPNAPTPAVAPSGAAAAGTPRSPPDDATCPARLKARAVAAEPVAIGPQPDARCTVVEAVRLVGLALPDGAKVDFPDHPTIACVTADAFSLYVGDLLVPLAKGSFGSPVAAVWTGPGLECRSRDHIFGAKLSAHGQGLAIDIAQLKLADGRLIAVGEPKSDVDQAFETASRAAGCGYFHTVLGPGSDSYHRTHWHFDLEQRGSSGDGKYCK